MADFEPAETYLKVQWLHVIKTVEMVNIFLNPSHVILFLNYRFRYFSGGLSSPK